jgi:UDP-N-acetylmuramyl pentapeptide synthase
VEAVGSLIAGACHLHLRQAKLAVIDDSINPNLRAPEAEVNFLAWYEFPQIQLAPAMPAKMAKQTLDCV